MFIKNKRGCLNHYFNAYRLTRLLKGDFRLFAFIEKTILIIVLFRILSGSIEIMAALLMIHYNSIERALLINSSLALIGPLIFMTTTVVGLFGIADKIAFANFFWILLGVSFILYGILST